MNSGSKDHVFKCDCGDEVYSEYKQRHLNSNKHLKQMASIRKRGTRPYDSYECNCELLIHRDYRSWHLKGKPHRWNQLPAMST